MPFTFLAHQAPVLPLVLLRPRWFDGVALCVGSVSPDLAYIVSGTPLRFASHTGPALLWFCLPATLVLGALTRRVAPALLAQLPLPVRRRLGPGLGAAPAWIVTVTSALIGAGSHVLLDGFTHPGGLAVAHFAWLRAPALTLAGRPMPVYSLLQGPGSLLLALVAVACLVALVRRAPGDDAPPPASGPAGRRTFLALTLAGMALALAVALAGFPVGGLPALILRLAALGFAALVIAALAAERVHE